MEFKHQKDLGPDSIQKWCEELDRKPKRELTKDEAKAFMICVMKEPEMRKESCIQQFLGQWNPVNILYRRIQSSHTFTIENAVLLYLGSVIDRPGIAVQYTNFIQYKCWKHSIKHVTMENFGKLILPDGLFTEDALREMWDKQKFIREHESGLANMLDYPAFMESIREIKGK